METKNKISAIMSSIEKMSMVRTVRNGLVHIIPVLVAGTFSLILQTFPVLAYQNAISTFFPIALVVLIFALINTIIIRVFDVDFLRTLMINIFKWLFYFGGTGFLKGFLFVMPSSLLWFFGIHGGDTLAKLGHLRKMGCDCYQGYLYSPAVFLK